MNYELTRRRFMIARLQNSPAPADWTGSGGDGSPPSVVTTGLLPPPDTQTSPSSSTG